MEGALKYSCLSATGLFQKEVKLISALFCVTKISKRNDLWHCHSSRWTVGKSTYFSFGFEIQVLATGLSGLYSSLPTKLEEKGEEWHCLLKDEWLLSPALVQFMNSLEFCNAVIQVTEQSWLVLLKQ